MPTTIVDVVRLIDKNKAIVAFFTPFILTVLGTLANWLITGEFNGQEIRIAAGGVITSIATLLAVYAAPAKQAEVRTTDIVASTPGHGPSVGGTA
jgi:hypothetical protein